MSGLRFPTWLCRCGALASRNPDLPPERVTICGFCGHGSDGREYAKEQALAKKVDVR